MANRLTFSDWLKNDSEQEQFNEWKEDGNVIKMVNGYATQDAQYTNRLKNIYELKKYYFNEFIKGQYDSYAGGGDVENLENYINIDKIKGEQYKIVTDFRTLRSLSKNGFIELHENTGLRYKNYEDKIKSQVVGRVTNVRHDYIKSATSPNFEYNNKKYAIGYIKGLNFLELYVLEDLSNNSNSFADGGSLDDINLVAKAIEYVTGSAIDKDSIQFEADEIAFKYKSSNKTWTTISQKLIKDTISMHRKSLELRGRYAEGGEVKVDGLTKQDFIDAYLKRVDSVIENLKQKGQYDSEDFDLLGEVDKEGGFTKIEDVGYWLNWADIKRDYDALIEIIWFADYHEHNRYQLDTLAHFFFRKPMKLDFYVNSGGDVEYAFNDELQKIKLLLNKIDFDEINGVIDYDERESNTDIQFYKDGKLVMSLKGDWNEESESLDTIIEIDGETTELNYHPLDSMGGLDLSQLENNINEAFRELNTYSAVVSIEGYEEYAEDVEGLENARATIQDIKGNTRFQVLKGSSVGIGKRVDDSRVVEEFRKGGNVSSIEKKVQEVNRLIELGNKNGISVVDSRSTWEAPMKYKPIRYSNGVLYVEYQQLDLYKYNKKGISNWVTKKDKVLKRDMQFDNPLNDIAKMYRKALKQEGVEYAEGGEAGFDDAGTSMGMYHEKKGNFIVPKGQIYLWLYDNEDGASKMNSGEYDFVMYPYASISMVGQRGFIPPLKRIWTKKFQKDHKGSEHLLGVVKAYLIEEKGKKELFIDMMSVNPNSKKKGIMSYMIKDLRDTFNLSQDQVTFSKLTKEGEKFIAKKQYSDGGLTRGEIENKIEGLKLRIAKTKKQISGYETTERGKYNKLFQEKVVPLQKELDTLSDLYGKSKYEKGGALKVGSKVGFLRPRTGRYEYAEVLSIDGDNVNLVVRHPKRSQWDNYFTETKERITKFSNTLSEDYDRPVMKVKYIGGGGVGEPYDSMTKYQIEKEYKKLNEKRDLLINKYGYFESDEILENEKEIDKIITLLYGKDFSGIGQKFRYTDGGVVIYKKTDLNRRDGKIKIVQVTKVDSYREALERIEELKKNSKNPNVTFFTGNIYADGGYVGSIVRTKNLRGGYNNYEIIGYNEMYKKYTLKDLGKDLTTSATTKEIENQYEFIDNYADGGDTEILTKPRPVTEPAPTQTPAPSKPDRNNPYKPKVTPKPKMSKYDYIWLVK